MGRRTKKAGIVALGDGRYRVRLVWTDPKTGRKRDTRKLVRAPNARAAMELRASLIAALQAPGSQGERLRLGDYATSWLKSRVTAWKASTKKTFAEVLDLHVVPMLGDFYIDAITPSDVVAWRDAQEAAPETVNGRLRVLRRVLRDASTELDIRDPGRGVASLRTAEPDATDKRSKGYTPEELRAVLAWIERKKPRWYPLCLTLAYTGLRFGEATALRWEDIDFAAGTIVVRRAQWKGIVDSPKAVASRRTVVAIPELVTVLRAHRQDQIKRQARGADSGFVFVSRRGTLPFQSVLTKPVKAAQVACSIARAIPAAHGFRHALNNLLRQHASEQVRRALVGHADSEAGEIYSHVGLEEKRAAIVAALRMVKA